MRTINSAIHKDNSDGESETKRWQCVFPWSSSQQQDRFCSLVPLNQLHGWDFFMVAMVPGEPGPSRDLAGKLADEPKKKS